MADFPQYPIQAAFARGEISPRLYSRADIDHWKLALRECVNWVVMKQGGLRRRSGTVMVNEVKDSTKKIRLVPFVFSTQQAYMIELGDMYARFYANGGLVTTTIARITGCIATAPLGGTAANFNDNSPVTSMTTGAIGDLTSEAIPGRIIAKLDMGSSKTITEAMVANLSTGILVLGQFQLVASSDAVTWTPIGDPFTIPDNVADISVDFSSSDAVFLGLAAAAEDYGARTVTIGEFTVSFVSIPVVTNSAVMPLGGMASKLIDDNTDTTANTDALGDLTAEVLADRVIAYVDISVGNDGTSPEDYDKITFRNISMSSAVVKTMRFFTSPDDTTYTPYGDEFIVSETSQNYTATGLVTTRYVAIAANAVNYDTATATLQDFNLYEVSPEAPIELSTPWALADLFDLQFTQSADILYVSHPNYPPRQITRTDATTFNLTTYDAQDGPYLPDNTTTTTITPSAVSGSVTITASAITGINNNAGFAASDVGRPISLQYSSKWYWALITAVSDSTHVTATVKGLIELDGTAVTEFPGTAATGNWRLGAWSETTGWPGSVGFYGQRLAWARTDTQPQTIWLTGAGLLKSFAQTIPAQVDDAVTVTILGGEVNAIQWLAEGSVLLIGTTGATRSLGPADTGKPFSSENLQQKRETTFGARRMQPVLIGNVAIYLGYFGKILRELIFSFQQNAFTSPELTILSEHIFRQGVVQMAYGQDSDSIIWVALGNGELCGITYERDQQIVAPHRHRLGGTQAADAVGMSNDFLVTGKARSYGFVESVATIPGATSAEVWLSVVRTINGTTKRYIERLSNFFESPALKEDAIFVDCSATYSGVAAATVPDIDWLENQTVSVLADGAVRPDVTVDGTGTITLASTAVKITYGLSYTSRAITLGIAQGSQDGTLLGRKMNVVGAKVDLLETGYLEVGSPNARDLEIVHYREPGEPMDDSPPLREGFKDVKFDARWKDFGVVVMQTDKPLPATIRAIEPVFVSEP